MTTTKKIELSELTAMGWALVDLEVKQLQQTGDVAMKFVVITRQGGQHFILTPPDAANHPGQKNAAARIVKKIVRDEQGIAVMTISDAYYSKMIDIKNPARALELADRISAMGLVEAERQGLTKKRECLMCNIVTPLEGKTLFAPYRRIAGGKMIVMEPRAEQPFDRGSGRFMEWFKDMPQGVA